MMTINSMQNTFYSFSNILISNMDLRNVFTYFKVTFCLWFLWKLEKLRYFCLVRVFCIRCKLQSRSVSLSHSFGSSSLCAVACIWVLFLCLLWHISHFTHSFLFSLSLLLWQQLLCFYSATFSYSSVTVFVFLLLSSCCFCFVCHHSLILNYDNLYLQELPQVEMLVQIWFNIERFTNELLVFFKNYAANCFWSTCLKQKLKRISFYIIGFKFLVQVFPDFILQPFLKKKLSVVSLAGKIFFIVCFSYLIN